ncbi:MAG TPA: alanine--tRNA ligase, partial [Nannocystis exedens]|nr:alanine--tRNA ligase [Nannocystis exedens]
ADLREGIKVFPPAVAADLYDTYGFPIDLTGVICREKGLTLDEAAVDVEVRRRQLSGGSAGLGSAKGIADVYFALQGRYAGASSFIGYDSEVAEECRVLAILVDGAEVNEVAEGQGKRVEFVVDRTPCYAESGGQVGDTGRLLAAGVDVEIVDTQKPAGDLHLHRGVVRQGTLRVGGVYRLAVDSERRAAIRRNHSATHLLHRALSEVLGPHVVQKGSLVAADRLRFDFAHGKALTAEQRREIERRVNAAIIDNRATTTREMELAEAKSAGALGLFGEKYGEVVRVVAIGPASVELCGGTHVRRAGDIGLFTILAEGGIAQGVRRIEAATGMGAIAQMQRVQDFLSEAVGELHAGSQAEVGERIRRLFADLKARDRTIAELQRKLTTGSAAEDTIVEVEGIKLLAKAVEVADPKALRRAADTLRDRLGSGVVVLGAAGEKKAMLLVAVTKDLAGKPVHAGKLVGALAHHLDGRGGGRPDLAQAGGVKREGLEAAIRGAEAALRDQLGA